MGMLDLFRGRARGRELSAPAVVRNDSGNSVFVGSIDDPIIQEFMRSGQGYVSTSGAVLTPDSALAEATAYRCTTLIGGAVATLPLDLKRRLDDKTRQDASDHPLWPVLKKKPNRIQTPSEFKRLMQVLVLLRGNAHAQIVRGARNRIIALVPLIGAMKTTVLPDYSLKYEFTNLQGKTTNFAQQEIFHLRGLSLDGINGVSVLRYAAETLGLSIDMRKHASLIFKNGALFRNIFKHKRAIDSNWVQRFRAILEEFRGGDRAHGDLILPEGMEYDKVGMTMDDLQFIQAKNLTAYEVAMYFGVPPHMVGLIDKTTSWGSGIEQQGIGFVTYTLQDWLTMWGESIERDLIDSDSEPDLYCRINPAGLVRGDMKTRYGAYAQGRQWGWLSANDVREKEDENPIEGGDTYLTPQNMAPVGPDAEGSGEQDRPGQPED